MSESAHIAVGKKVEGAAEPLPGKLSELPLWHWIGGLGNLSLVQFIGSPEPKV